MWMTEQGRKQDAGSLTAWSLLAAKRYEASEWEQLHSDAIGLACLWATRNRWAHRVVEQVSFIDNERMRRRLSIDVELPWAFLDSEVGFEIPGAVIPLLAGTGAELLTLDAQNGEGQSLPIRTAGETTVVAIAAMKRLLEQEKFEAGRAQRRHTEEAPVSTATGKDEWNEERSAEALAEAVSRRQLILIDLPRTSAKREHIRVHWEETLRLERSRLWLPGRIGARVRAAAVPAAGRHIEVNAPPGLEVGSFGFSSAAPESKGSASTAHAFTTSSHRDSEFMVSLRPKRRTALAFLAPALSVSVFAIALIGASDLSSSQSVAGGLLLAIPSLWAAYMVRTDAAGSWVGWDLNGIFVGLTSFLAAMALVLEASQLALDLTLVIAAIVGVITALAAAASATFELKVDFTESREPVLASYLAGSLPSTQPTDEEVQHAVEQLIESARNPEDEEHSSISEQAAELAEEQSFVEVPRPMPPQLAGALAEDVLLLTHLKPETLAAQLAISPRALSDRLPDTQLSAEERQKLAAVRAAALVLYGGLGRQGVTEWLSSGDNSPLHRIAQGEVKELQQQLDRYSSSPAE